MTGQWRGDAYWYGSIVLGNVCAVIGTDKWRAVVEYRNLSGAAKAMHCGPFTRDVATWTAARRLVEEVTA